MIGPVTGTRVVITAAAVTLLLGLAACSSDDPEPRVAPPTSQAPSTSSTAPTTSPSGSDDEEAFVRGFFQSVAQATQTGKTAAFLAMTAPTCANCRVLASNIEDAFAGNRRVEGANWQISRTAPAGHRTEGSVWNVDVHTAEEHWYDGSGELLKTVSASTQHFGVIVTRSDDDFLIQDMRLRS